LHIIGYYSKNMEKKLDDNGRKYGKEINIDKSQVMRVSRSNESLQIKVGKRELKEIGINMRDWIDSAQDKNYWRALVNVLLNLRVPQIIQLVS
jgi:hypothetical protein